MSEIAAQSNLNYIIALPGAVVVNNNKHLQEVMVALQSIIQIYLPTALRYGKFIFIYNKFTGSHGY